MFPRPYPHPLCRARTYFALPARADPADCPVVKAKSTRRPAGEEQAMVLRVRRIVGQLQAIERMLVDERECSDVLMQIVAARRALIGPAGRRGRG